MSTFEDRKVAGLIFNIQKYSVHDGPGIRTVVFTKGCPLRCRWCSNPESQVHKPQMAFNPGRCISPEKCGYCIPGMVIAAYYLLENNPDPTEEDVRLGISGNICRCTGYDLIVESILLAARRGEALWKK